jgi:hypothetical protein
MSTQEKIAKAFADIEAARVARLEGMADCEFHLKYDAACGKCQMQLARLKEAYQLGYERGLEG